MRYFSLFLVLMFSFYDFAHGQGSKELLQKEDVQRIMKQILEHHVDKRDVTAQVIQGSLVNFIDQFDPNKVYLLQNEVNPYLNLSQTQLQELLQQYKNNNFSIFEQLIALFQRAIERSRTIRTYEEAQIKQLLIAIKKQEIVFPISKSSGFAQNEIELQKRIKDQIAQFFYEEQKRTNEANIIKNKEDLLGIYERSLQEHENHYLFRDMKNRSLNEDEKEHLFTFHLLKALARSLDSHTTFYQPSEAYDMRVKLQKQFEGIGLLFKDSPNGIIVSHIIDGAPAQKNGQIQIGDRLIAIGDVSLLSYNFEYAMNLLHEEKNKIVKLTFVRTLDSGTKKEFTVELAREPIVIDQDRVEVSEEPFGNGYIGKITLHAFYQGNGISSEKDVRNAIKKLQSKGPLKGLILDLRDNGGGFLSQAVKVAGLFITNGVIVISKYANGEEKFYRDVDSKVAYNGPLIVLTSKATASAAEIVAQALQDYGVALVVGDEKTYGKGTIQSQTVTDGNSSSYFKVTVGQYYTVSGKSPQYQGVKPDILVPGKYSSQMIGEEYEDSIPSESIPSYFTDNLEDVSSDVKDWYLRFYIPTLQPRRDKWQKLVPILQKNSSKRIQENKNYQYYLKELTHGKKEDENELEEDEDEEEIILLGRKDKNYGKSDLQLEEAKNILKDMILIDSLEDIKRASQ